MFSTQVARKPASAMARSQAAAWMHTTSRSESSLLSGMPGAHAPATLRAMDSGWVHNHVITRSTNTAASHAV